MAFPVMTHARHIKHWQLSSSAGTKGPGSEAEKQQHLYLFILKSQFFFNPSDLYDKPVLYLTSGISFYS